MASKVPLPALPVCTPAVYLPHASGAQAGCTYTTKPKPLLHVRGSSSSLHTIDHANPSPGFRSGSTLTLPMPHPHRHANTEVTATGASRHHMQEELICQGKSDQLNSRSTLCPACSCSSLFPSPRPSIQMSAEGLEVPLHPHTARYRRKLPVSPPILMVPMGTDRI